MAQRVAWLPSKPVAVALVRKEAVRKLVRTESDGAGHAGAGAGGEIVKGLRPALSRPSGINLNNTRARVLLARKSW